MQILSLILIISLLTSCNEKAKYNHVKYLDDKMNSQKSITNYEYQALEYENSITGTSNPIAYKRVGKCLIYAESAQVSFNENHIDLNINLHANALQANKWVESTSIEERRSVCEDICAAHIDRLASMLNCKVDTIEVQWSCANGAVSGSLSGSSNVPAK